MLKLSVITVNFNDSIGLSRTIKSFVSQLQLSKELIVIDGGSTDDSLEVIKNNKSFISNWLSEKDDGIYDAMNKGLELVNGDFVIFMNSGDMFLSPDVLSEFSKTVNSLEKVYFGRAKIISDKGISWFYPNCNYNVNNISSWLRSNLPNHQAMFFPKNFYLKERFNLKYEISSDADYKYRAIKSCGYVFLDIKVCNFYLGGVSSNFNNFKRTKQIAIESMEIVSKHRSKKKAVMRVSMIYFKYIISSISNKYFISILSYFRR